jgi:hypothetical protein
MDSCPFCKAPTLKSAPFIAPEDFILRKKLACGSCGFKGTIVPERILDAVALGGVASKG